VLKDYVLATSNTNPTNYVEVPQNLAAGVHGEGNYIVFRGLTASNITLEATTVAPQGSGTPPRAPVNAVQLVPAAPSGPKFTGISKQGNNVVIQWTPATAVLQSATLVTGPYTDVGGASGGTYSAPLTDAPRYFRLK
jgi:hypothetical protein